MIDQLLKETIQNALNTSDFHIDEIRGGFSKQVYRITTQADSFMLYIWRRPCDNQLTENQTKGIEYLFPEGFTHFMHNTKLLTDLGIRVPYILVAGHHDEGDFDYAMVECFKGQSLDKYMRNGGNVAAVADKIITVMDRMAAEKRPFYGAPLDNEPNDIPAAQLVFDFTAEELNIASRLDNEVADIQSNLLHLMRQKMDEMMEMERQEYSLIHGELTPPHVFILENGDVGLIDIEGIKYFDVEYDWAVINLSYGDRIPLPESINNQKLEFYKLCWKIVHVSGAVDYLVHVDGHHEWFRNFRERNLQALKKIVL